MHMNSISAYGKVSKALHWIIAVLIFFMIALGFFMTWLSSGTAVEVEQKIFFYSLHKTIGIMTLMFIILRIFWSLINKKPQSLSSHNMLERIAASMVHSALYAGMLIIPLSGWIHHSASPGFAPIWLPIGQSLPFIESSQSLALLSSYVHQYAAWAIVLILGMHISGAVKHVIFDRDETLRRMLPGKRNFSTTGASTGGKYLGISAQGIFILAVFSVSLYSLSWEPKEPSYNPVELNDQSSKQANWVVNYPDSKLAIGVKLGEDTNIGVFNNWSASIFFDEKNLNQSWVNVTINTSSLDLGALSKQAISADFLNSKTFPTATFKSEKFLKTNQGDYIAEGKLSIGGISSNLSLPFSLTIDGDNATMRSEILVNRMDYNIGAAGFNNETNVKFDVSIEINLVVSKP